MTQPQPNNPLHGVTLKAMLEYLVAEYGWERLSERIKIDSFRSEPSINSSLKFLRKTEWARAKVERLYVYSISYDEGTRSHLGSRPDGTGGADELRTRHGRVPAHDGGPAA